MSKWKIRFRAQNGVAEAMVTANTLEAAEDAFKLHLLEHNIFGVILKTTPMGVHGSPDPTA